MSLNYRINPERLPHLTTRRLGIRLLEPREATMMVRFRKENREYLAPFEPRRPPEFFTHEYWNMQLRNSLREFRTGTSVCLVILDRQESEVVGVCNYTNIVRGTFEACHLGYALAQRHQGQGLMYEALTESNRYVFKEIGLNRIMANYLPRNARSGRLLARLGFVVEGEAKRFLKINGRWEDHILTSKVIPQSKDD
ncbi:MAG: ribosomal protein S5-alanine N-acetyltransferase [Pseudomonadales bacterium]